MRIDTIFSNATVLTLSATGSVAGAFAVGDGRIVAAGSTADMRALGSAETREIDLESGVVVPGFNDTHNHMLETGLEMGKLQLGGVRSLGELLEAIRKEASGAPAGSWVVCSAAWHESRLAERRLPNRWELDRVAPQNPVYLPRGGHTAVVNSRALQIAGIGRDTSNPPGGEIKRDAKSGEPTGLLFEPAALRMVQRHMPAASRDEKREAVRRAMRAFHAAGITSIVEPGLGPEELDVYRDLHENGALQIRTSCMVGFGWFKWPDATVANIEALGRYAPSSDPILRVDGIKLFIDGGIESALLSEPYCLVQGEQEDPAYKGVQIVETEQLDQIVRTANRNDWRVGIHAVGDAGVDIVLKSYSKAHAERPIDGRRWMLIHGILPQPSHFPLLRQMGIVVASQVHHHALGENMLRYWGRERAQRANPIHEYLEHGIRVTGGTDSMVCPYSQTLALWSWIARRSAQGNTVGPPERVTREQALKLHTAWASYITFEEEQKGTIEPGRLADFAVLSRNPLDCPLDELASIEVVRTVVGGETVWQREG